jgi:small subunit ribosomal protein S4
VTIPSFSVARGELVQVAEKSRSITVFKEAKERRQGDQLCEWLTRDLDKLSGQIIDMPGRDAIPVNVNEQLIVELYSK